MRARLFATAVIVGLASFASVGNASAQEEPLVVQGIEFAHGEKSFIDSVVTYEINDNTDVEAPYDDPTAALGVPDCGTDDAPEPCHVPLGNATDDGTPGVLILAFDENRLINIEGDDLYIFEVGPQVEASEVAVSHDGEEWVELGMIEGSTRGLDLAEFPEIHERAAFQYVRLRDVPNGNTSGSPYGGPDIDAIGAIGSVDASEVENGRLIDQQTDGGCGCSSTDRVPGSVSLALLGLGLLGLARI
ncbi:MAG: hypothetical protein ACQEVA_22745, partial [Myxococcota bacterium]